MSLKYNEGCMYTIYDNSGDIFIIFLLSLVISFKHTTSYQLQYPTPNYNQFLKVINKAIDK